MPMHVVLGDDHALFRNGLAFLLKDAFDVAEISDAADFEQVVEALSEMEDCNLLLIDLNMPGLSGADDFSALREAFAEIKIVVVSGSEDRRDMLAAAGSGVHGYIPKSMSAAEITLAVARIMSGEVFFPPSLSFRPEPSPPAAAAHPSLDCLTDRQKAVLAELVKGYSSKQIGRTLDIAEGTVKVHLAAIYRALGVRTRTEAIVTMAAAGQTRR